MAGDLGSRDLSGTMQQAGAGAVLAYLRTVTRPSHDALEGALGLLDEQLEAATYRTILQRFYGFWRDWEPQVATLLQDDALLGPRRRLHLLAADLTALGMSGHAMAALPSCPLPPLADAAAALGSLYVMEGSTLGGRVIQRHIGRRLGLDEQSGGSYFAGYGTQTGMMWRSFLVRLDQAPMAEAGRIGSGATATFERLAWWLTREPGATG